MCSYNHKQNKIWKFPYISVCLLTFPVWSLILLATDSNCSFFATIRLEELYLGHPVCLIMK